jgi:hypothetical protein
MPDGVLLNFTIILWLIHNNGFLYFKVRGLRGICFYLTIKHGRRSDYVLKQFGKKKKKNNILQINNVLHRKHMGKVSWTHITLCIWTMRQAYMDFTLLCPTLPLPHSLRSYLLVGHEKERRHPNKFLHQSDRSDSIKYLRLPLDKIIYITKTILVVHRDLWFSNVFYSVTNQPVIVIELDHNVFKKG